jgi:hypothetical protein
MKPRMSIRQSVLLTAAKLHIRKMQEYTATSEQEDVYHYRRAIRCLYLATGWSDNESVAPCGDPRSGWEDRMIKRACVVQKTVYVVRYTYRGEGYCSQDFDSREEAIKAANAFLADKWQGEFVEERTANIPA